MSDLLAFADSLDLYRQVAWGGFSRLADGSRLASNAIVLDVDIMVMMCRRG